MDVATISILLIIIGCILGLAEWVRLVKNDASFFAARIHTLETHVEHLEEEVKELKKDEKSIEAIVQKALEEKIINEKTIALLKEYYNISDIE